jgi:nucleoside-diphosphate kinase
MAKERSLVLVKPDGVANGHIGDIISRIEKRRYEIDALKVVRATPEMIRTHYAKLVNEPFYPGIEKYMLSGPIVAMIVSGTRVVEVLHHMAGATDPGDAEPGTIRGDFARSWDTLPIRNVIHTSGNEESAEREIGIWFPERA